MSAKKSYWIKERNNPQFKKPYYIGCGQLSEKEAQEKKESLYGYNVMHEYSTLEEYNDAIAKLELNGYHVR